ncbi:MAG: hypothetical protein QW728_00165 [Thermoplasmata archaeon]
MFKVKLQRWVPILFIALLPLITSIAAAGGFDGVYDLTLSGRAYDPVAKVWKDVSATEKKFLVISGGSISDTYYDTHPHYTPGSGGPAPSGDCEDYWCSFQGAVSSNGSAEWTGGSFIHGLNIKYTYTGSFSGSGGSGTYTKPGMEKGNWEASASSGGLVAVGLYIMLGASILALFAAAFFSFIPAPKFRPPVKEKDDKTSDILLQSSPSSLPPSSPSTSPSTPTFPSTPPPPSQQPAPIASPLQNSQASQAGYYTTSGTKHLVPADAVMQWPAGSYPPQYPHPPGTKASMECPFCHQITLSPFKDGWFCTNVRCPHRKMTDSNLVEKEWW